VSGTSHRRRSSERGETPTFEGCTAAPVARHSSPLFVGACVGAEAWKGRLRRDAKRVSAGQLAVSGADDGIRTRDPHLGNCMAGVSCVSTDLSSVPELHVLVALVSCVSTDRWSRLDFVGDFVGVRGTPAPPPTPVLHTRDRPRFLVMAAVAQRDHAAATDAPDASVAIPRLASPVCRSRAQASSLDDLHGIRTEFWTPTRLGLYVSQYQSRIQPYATHRSACRLALRANLLTTRSASRP
jgi:hypothetical protein